MAPTATSAKIASLSELLTLAKPGDLILLDLDETLLSPETDASEPWFHALKDEMIKRGVEAETSWLSAVEVWQAAQNVCDVKCTEDEVTLSVLKELKGRGHTIMGLTARGPEVAQQTVSQLERCGIQPFLEAPSAGVLAPAAPSDPLMPLTHERGVIYCSGARKPEGLLAYETRLPPGLPTERRVVFVDDRDSHVQAVQREMERQGRAFLGLHYTRVSDAARGAGAYGLPRGWQLFAAMLAHGPAARESIRRSLRVIDTGSLVESRNARARVSADAAAGLALGLLAGATLGAIVGRRLASSTS